MADAVFDELAKLEARRDAWRAAVAPDAAEAAIAADLARYDVSKLVDGVNTVVGAERAKYEAGRRALYDQERREEAAALERDHAALFQTIRTATEAFRQPPTEANAGPRCDAGDSRAAAMAGADVGGPRAAVCGDTGHGEPDVYPLGRKRP
jgi:hypothetical protein